MYKELILELSQENDFVKIQSPCSEREIVRAEKAVGYSFPKELKNLLLELNGDKWLFLSIKEIIEQAELNKEIQKENSGEEFVRELDKYIFFATNGCGDYYCYHANTERKIDENSIYIWNHEDYCAEKIATSIIELITRYYKNEI